MPKSTKRFITQDSSLEEVEEIVALHAAKTDWAKQREKSLRLERTIARLRRMHFISPHVRNIVIDR